MNGVMISYDVMMKAVGELYLELAATKTELAGLRAQLAEYKAKYEPAEDEGEPVIGEDTQDPPAID